MDKEEMDHMSSWHRPIREPDTKYFIKNVSGEEVPAKKFQPTSTLMKELKMAYFKNDDVEAPHPLVGCPKVATAADVTSTTTKTQKGNTVTDTLMVITDRNKDAALRAVTLSTGRVALTVLKQQIVPRLPPWAQGYAEGPLTDVVLANGVNLAVMWNLHRGNTTIEQLRDAMMEAAMVSLMDSFNPGQFISDFLSKMTMADPKVLETFKV